MLKLWLLQRFGCRGVGFLKKSFFLQGFGVLDYAIAGKWLAPKKIDEVIKLRL